MTNYYFKSSGFYLPISILIIELSIVLDYLLFVIMIKFNTVSTKKSTPNPTPNHPSFNRIIKHNTVTPFAFEDQPLSPLPSKVDNSPLQIPLAIAIKQIIN